MYGAMYGAMYGLHTMYACAFLLIVVLAFVAHALLCCVLRADDYEVEQENDELSGLTRFHGEINRVADEFFYRLGHWVATFPRRTLAIGSVCVALCCTGFLNFAVESSGRLSNLPVGFTLQRPMYVA